MFLRRRHSSSSRARRFLKYAGLFGCMLILTAYCLSLFWHVFAMNDAVFLWCRTGYVTVAWLACPGGGSPIAKRVDIKVWRVG